MEDIKEEVDLFNIDEKVSNIRKNTI